MNKSDARYPDPIKVLDKIDEMREFFWLAMQSNPQMLARAESNIRLAIEKQMQSASSH